MSTFLSESDIRNRVLFLERRKSQLSLELSTISRLLLNARDLLDVAGPTSSQLDLFNRGQSAFPV